MYLPTKGREHVELYAIVKGVRKGVLNAVVAAKLKEVGLSEADSNRLSSEYSGGMKRKLSVACATVGSPRIGETSLKIAVCMNRSPLMELMPQ